MTADLLDRLRVSDPAADADLTAPEDLLSRLLADFPDLPARSVPARHPVRRRLVVGLAGTALAAGVFTTVSLVGGPAAPGPDLAAQAYAQTSDEFGVLYVRTRVAFELDGHKLDGSPLVDRHASTSESWLFGDRGRVHADFGATGWSDSVLSPDGSVHFRNGDGQDIVTTDADGPDAVSQRENLTKNFVNDFRREYQKGTLDPGGTTTFAGKPAQRYSVQTSGVAPADPRLHMSATPWTMRREFFVATADGAPLGSITTERSTTNGHTSAWHTTETVEAIEHLPATPENLALLEFNG